jgi:O-antigen ligase
MKNKVLHSLLYLLYLALLLSMLCAFPAISSIGIAVLLVTAFITNRSEHHSIVKTGPVTWYLMACTLFFLLQVTGLLYTDHPKEGWQHVQLKSSILFIPLCFYVYRFINTDRLHRLMTHYTWLLIAASLYCLIVAINTYQHAGTGIFFYHDLVRPFRHHAIHYSIMVFTAFIFLVEKAHTRQYLINRFVHVAIMGFLTGFLLLLSSKLVIVFLAGYLLLFLFFTVKKNVPGRYFAVTIALTGLLLTGLVVCSPNPVSRRSQDMLHGNVRLIQQPPFSPAHYFNALQFRLLQCVLPQK